MTGEEEVEAAMREAGGGFFIKHGVARAAISAHLEALRAAGWVVEPPEGTRVIAAAIGLRDALVVGMEVTTAYEHLLFAIEKYAPLSDTKGETDGGQ